MLMKWLAAILLCGYLSACAVADEEQLAGTWRLKQEMGAAGTLLSVADSSDETTLIITSNGTYKLTSTGSDTGQWHLLRSGSKTTRALQLEAAGGNFQLYVIDSLSSARLVLRTGLGRRLVFARAAH